mgnify:CR=1 FL=1
MLQRRSAPKLKSKEISPQSAIKFRESLALFKQSISKPLNLQSLKSQVATKESLIKGARKKSLPEIELKPFRLISTKELDDLMVKMTKNIEDFKKAHLISEFKHLNKCENLKKIITGKLIGVGREGFVYELPEDKKYVIKISEIQDMGDLLKTTVESLASLILANEVRKKNTIHFPITSDVFTCQNSHYDIPHFYMIMEKLEPLKFHTFSPTDQEILLFQIFASVYFMQEKFIMSHQDLHFGNIMLKRIPKINPYLNYQINKKWYQVPNIGYAIVIIDFGFATFSYKHEKYFFEDIDISFKPEFNISKNYRPFYDLYFFAKNFEYMFDKNIDPNIKNIVNIITGKIPKQSRKDVRPKPGLILPHYDATSLFEDLDKLSNVWTPKTEKWPFTNKWFSLSPVDKI